MAVYYGSIALTADQARLLAGDLRADPPPTHQTDPPAERLVIADALDARADDTYSQFPDDWVPFGGESVRTLMENKPSSFRSATIQITNLDDNLTNFATFWPNPNIALFVVDPFACYLNKYRQLAVRLDAALVLTDTAPCCFALPYGLDPTLHDILVQRMDQAWGTVIAQYAAGKPHRVAARDADLLNVKGVVFNRAPDAPHPDASRAARHRYGASQQLPGM